MNKLLNQDRSNILFEAANKFIPGGVNSPVRAFTNVGGTPPFIKRGKGAYIWDEDDNRYIDFVGSWGPMILGHSHPAVVGAIQKMAKNGTSFGAPTEQEIILAEMIVNRVPGCDMVRLVNSGTEATMTAIRLARAITERDKIIKFEGSYHGHGDSFLIAAGSGALTLGQPDSPGVTNSTARDTLIARFNDIQSVSDIFQKFSDQIGAVIVEPVIGNSGCIPPENNFLENLRTLCMENDSLLIFDEVMTGFRIAKGGAAEYYGVTPDLYTFGKVIGGGFPIGAYGGKKEYLSYISPVGPVYQAGTLSGNPIAVNAGIETLRQLNQDAYQQLETMADYFEKNIQSIIDDNEYPLSQNRVGSMFSLFFHPGPIQNVKDVAQCDMEGFKYYFHFLLQNGIYIAPSQFETGFISLAHNQEILDTMLNQLSDVFTELYVPI